MPTANRRQQCRTRGGESIYGVPALILLISILISFAPFSGCRQTADMREPIHTTEVEEAPVTWLLGQMGAAGLINSFDDDSRRAYTYGQALAVIAFAVSDNLKAARTILSTLRNVQGKDGSFGTLYHADTGAILQGTPYVGNNSWIIMAVNFYTLKSGDRGYLDMAARCADWILTLQDEESGGFRGAPDKTWYSAEHHADAYSAFHHLGLLLNEPVYEKTALTVKNFIARKLHVSSPESGGRGKERPAFWTGWRDTAKLGTDPQTWIPLALASTDYPHEHLESALRWLLSSKCRKQVDWSDNIRNIDGFDWDEFDRFQDDKKTPENESTRISGNVWFEGNEGAVAAFICMGMEKEANYFHEQTKLVMAENGGIPYSTPHPDLFRRANPALSVASTAWYVFNEYRINPFDPDQ